MMEQLFVVSIIFIFYPYFGYPLSLYIIGIFVEQGNIRNIYIPYVTMIIAVFNEENKIEDKILNTLSTQYPKDKLQIIIASDGSNDRTVEIAKIYEKDGIEVLIIENRAGKENAQKEAVRIAKGDILVFTDVATILEPEGLAQIVSNFADSRVGCASSEDRLIQKDGKVSGEGFYIRYEMWLRRLESRCNSLVGLSGSFFAARKIVCEDFSGNMQSDFRTVLNSIKKGFRCVSDPNAIGYYLDVKEKGQEFERKVRTVLRGLTVFFNHLEFLNVFRYGLFSYQFFCHKLLRWLVPLFLSVAFISNLFLVLKSPVYFIIFIVQLIFYGIAVWSCKTNRLYNSIVIKIPKYFLTVNGSIFIAWLRYIRRQRVVFWTPSER